ncbi:alpha-L-fucosidase [Arthrobacter sp. MYb23]|uniref:alpha-L-fucosidase n=1 Tax=unclassified Arthrobacter TaxID=235627 RepID=UPI000CFCA426|nr:MULTISPECIES: alpha-L-fucosidase [unclassified Arthrobacter]PRB40668.1 alpha-L-fucosidase [Arthrobacter sp. MYb51]PRB94448.1 alpha-L-fucosidase [Arthrobacter sp. MYb23]
MIRHAPWFEEARLGMFVHWGLYALPARHEWVMNQEETTVEEYSKYFQRFDPDLYDPREWARAARDAGMKYVVLTTKHHDGFCLWDSALTDYKATNTPAGRDLIAPYVEALRAEGLRVGFYHSLIDWHHPDFTIDGVHPQRNAADVESLNAGRDMARYREYLHGQVRELLSNYGTIDYLFFDFSYADTRISEFWGGKGSDDWDSEKLLAMVRELQPGIVVNDRLGIPGDLVTPEQYQPTEPMMLDGEAVTWEACQTLNGSWGYHRDNLNYKTVDLLIRMLVDGVSNGGNLLLNIGPTGRGSIDPRALTSLEGIGEWMKLHSRSIYGAGPAPFTAPQDTRYTQRGNRLYVHLFAWPFEYIHLPGLAGKVEYAQLLNDASEVFLKEVDPDQEAFNTIPGGQPPGTLTVKLPVQRPDVAVPVLELYLKEAAGD